METLGKILIAIVVIPAVLLGLVFVGAVVLNIDDAGREIANRASVADSASQRDSVISASDARDTGAVVERGRESAEERVAPDTVTVQVKDTQFEADVAATPTERAQGLSGRRELLGRGMLFVFPRADYYGIWMKEMHFPIDIIWLDDERRVVDLKERVSPDTYPEVFTPRRPARFVLEVSSGFADRENVRLNDIFVFSQEPQL